MDHNSETSKQQENSHFDYFYTLLKNWKTILLICLVAAIIAVLSVFLLSKSVIVKSSFTVSLDEAIETPYGTYKRNTINPIYYVATLEQKSFKDNVTNFLGVDGKNVKLEVESEKVKQSNDQKEFRYPYKFDLIVSGSNKEELEQINETALNMFVKEIDKRTLLEMYNNFISHNKLAIKDLKLDIKLKKELIDTLEKAIENKESLNLNSDKDFINRGLLNNFEDSERGIIISMLLNQGQGKDYYYNAMISIEKVSLKKSVNTLEKQEELYQELKENYENGTLQRIFIKPFSEDFSILQTAEEFTPENKNKYLKRILIAVFFGFVFSSTVILVKAYYADRYKG